MEQEIQPQQSNLNKKLIIMVVISIFTTALIVGFGVYFLATNSIGKITQTNQNQISEIDTTTKQSTVNNKKIEDTDESILDTVQLDKTYFAKGGQGKYTLVDVDTGDTSNFIPEGYEIIGQHDYDPLPKFLILKRDKNLFSFEIENQLVNKIFTFDDLLLKDNEQTRIFPSITEKNKFFLVVTKHNLSVVSEFDGSSPIIDTRSYTFNASTNELIRMSNIDLGCAEYDSKNKRFFTWRCGEGIGSSMPLAIADINGQKQKEVISFSDFGLSSNDTSRVAIEYNNGIFFAILKSSNSFDKIIVVDPKQQEPQKENYTITEAVKSEINNSYPYSMGLAKSQNTFVIGGGHFITLLRIVGNQITESKTIPEQGLYANFIFPHEGKLYYQSKEAKAIRLIDLDTWQVTKTIPIEISEEITLIKIKK